jgi:hypothetical protein
VPIGYALAGSGTSDVTFSFSVDHGVTWSGATPATGCPSTKQRPIPGSYTFTWDTAADSDLVSGDVLVRAQSGGQTVITSTTVATISPTFLQRSAAIDAADVTRSYAPTNRGHYDLSPVTLDYLADPHFAPNAARLPVKSWRISVGRWEIGPAALLAPEAAAYSTDPAQLRTASREYYRGPASMAGAIDPDNYHFGYLDAEIRAVVACGATPYLCFDYMPFTLASNQDPNTADNLYLGNAALSFSNGIRTSPPSDNAVYAEVVKRVVMHVTGTFAAGLRVPLDQIEIGNEPDLTTATGVPLKYFWTGTDVQFTAMYQACATALDAQFGGAIAIGGGSFAFVHGEPTPTFMQRFLAGLGTSRLDFVAFHCYSDTPETGFVPVLQAAKALRDAYRPAAQLYCPEWGMELGGNDLSRFQSMSTALHSAKVLEYFTLFDVVLAHHAILRDPVPDQIGLMTTGSTLKPAAYAFAAYEMLAQTPGLCAITAVSPADKPMIIAGSGANGITVLFFHEKPPAGQIGRLSLALANPPIGGWTAQRYLLTDGTVGTGDGLAPMRRRSGTGPLIEELRFTQDVLVVWRITQGSPLPVPRSNG